MFIVVSYQHKNRRSLPAQWNKRLSSTVSASGSIIIQDTTNMLPIRQRSSSLKTPFSSNIKNQLNRKSLNETLFLKTQNEIINQQGLVNTSDYESGESPSGSDTEKVANSNENSTKQQDLIKKLEGICEENLMNRFNYNKDLPWNPNDCDKLEILNYIHDWSFPIFTFAEKSDNFVLSKVYLKQT